MDDKFIGVILQNAWELLAKYFGIEAFDLWAKTVGYSRRSKHHVVVADGDNKAVSSSVSED